MQAGLPERRRRDGRWRTVYEPGPIRRGLAALGRLGSRGVEALAGVLRAVASLW